ncbi:hypothetical protein CPB86DRAFT_826273 [Serendipita vermifera]|nr:hypothetical protein CPB86DRAFT_826273 [Serendipita vermifera]
MADAWTIPSMTIQEGPPSVVVPASLLELVLDFVVPPVGVDTFEARYLAAMRSGWLCDSTASDFIPFLLKGHTFHPRCPNHLSPYHYTGWSVKRSYWNIECPGYGVTWWFSDDEKWHQLLASPLLGVILSQSTISEGFSIHSLLTQMAGFSWFYEEFSRANGLDWLPLISLHVLHPSDRKLKAHALTEILVDQILFSTANQDVQMPLLCSYYYLQSIGQTLLRSHNQLANLRVALVWVLKNSIKVYNYRVHMKSLSPLVFDPPVLERIHWPTLGEVRSFDFICNLLDEEWEQWTSQLKVLIMGSFIGGLKPSPFQNANRFYRDPDGICGRV